MTPAKNSQNWLPGIFNDFFGNEWITKTNSSAPAINIIEDDKEYKVEVAAPGLTKDDFNVHIDDNDHLIISVEDKKENSEKDKRGKFLRREFSYSQFQQTLVLPDNVDKNNIEAKQECIDILNNKVSLNVQQNRRCFRAQLFEINRIFKDHKKKRNAGIDP